MPTRTQWLGAVLLGLTLLLPDAFYLEAGSPQRTFPKTVLIIRHAEKPPEGNASVALSAQGKERAKTLHKLFKKDRPHPFPKPDYIFATHNSKHSHRPVETVTPLAKRLHLLINEDYSNAEKGTVKGKGKKAEPGMVELRQRLLGDRHYHGKTVLICWHHGTIPELARLLGATKCPTKWHGDTFDRIWQLTYDATGHVTFADLPQHLLPGDSTK
ncbi:MAG TPA: hypothetical protein VMF69_03240 [Gemmataceae bacterium]|nr:hypothetical protein [Gemmataceae bacterium]